MDPGCISENSQKHFPPNVLFLFCYYPHCCCFPLAIHPVTARIMKSNHWSHLESVFGKCHTGLKGPRWRGNVRFAAPSFRAATLWGKQLRKLSVKPDNPWEFNPPSGRSLPEMDTGSFLERALCAWGTTNRPPSTFRWVTESTHVPFQSASEVNVKK